MAEPLYQPFTPTGTINPYTPTGLTGYVPFVPPTLPMATTSPYAQPTLSIIGESGFPSFSFDFEQEQALAYNQLKPFYEQLLNIAGGNLDLARRMIEQTYEQGMRESAQENEQQAREQAITFPQEQAQLSTEQNRRGILQSGFGQTERTRQTESQNIRKDMIARALENRQSRLTSERGFGLEEKQRGFGQEQFDFERQRRKEAGELANTKFGIKQTEYQGLLSQAQRNEQRRIQAATSGTTGGGTPAIPLPEGNLETMYWDIPGRGSTKVGDLYREGYFSAGYGGTRI